MKADKGHLLKARVDEAMHAAINRLAASRGENSSVIVRDAIQYYLAARAAAHISDESPLQLPHDPHLEAKRVRKAA